MMLDYLKKNTAAIHQKVEQDNLAKYIIDHTISQDNYQKLLLQNFKFYHTIEQALLRKKHLINASLHPFLSTQKSELLAKDLQSAAYEVEVEQIRQYDHPIPSENAALGALYVSEGSALGGLLISKHLHQCPALQSIPEHHFFKNDVSSILSRWKTFRQTVEEHFGGDAGKEEVLQSAIKTFELFGQIVQD